ncbi:MAG: ABC transporter permease [Fimbriimonadaceae bacterium]
MRLAKAILLRVLFGAISLLFITFVAFIADEIAPGDAATVAAGEKATIAQIEHQRKLLGLDRPWHIRYVEMIGNIAQGDFGKSYVGTKEPVADIIKRTLPMTMRSALFAMLIAIIVGVTLGTIAAVYENRFGDRTILVLSTLGVTVPNFVLAPLLVFLWCLNPNKFAQLVSYGNLDKLPLNWTPDRVAPDFYYLLIPVLVLSLRPMAMLTRLTRASMVETLKQEFIKLATAKGVSPFRLIVGHALRNAILPVVTAIGTSFGFLLTGSFVVERFFTMPGLGSTAIEAILQTNGPVIIGTIIVSGFLFIFVNMLVDIMLPILDPRIREAQV